MAEIILIIRAAIQVARLGAQVITIARDVYKVNEGMRTLDHTLSWYKQRLDARDGWFTQCNADDLQQARQAHGDAKNLVDEARGALGYVQGLRNDVYNSSSSRSGVSKKIKAYFALDSTKSKSLDNARAEFDKALYDLDMRILNLKLYRTWLDSWLTRSDNIVATLALGTGPAGENLPIAGNAPDVGSVSTVPASDGPAARQARERLKFDSRIGEVDLRPRQKIKIAVLSLSGRYIGLFATTQFWIYDAGVYSSPSGNDRVAPAQFLSPHPALIAEGLFDNRSHNYYFGPAKGDRHSYSGKIKIRRAALSDDFVAICSKTRILVFTRPGPCVCSINLGDENILQLLFCPSGTKLLFVSTISQDRHQAVILPTEQFPRNAPTDIPTVQPQRTLIAQWKSTYTPRRVSFSSDGKKIIIGTSNLADGKCEIRIFEFSSLQNSLQRQWRNGGNCAISIQDGVSGASARLTGIQMYSSLVQ
jgi:hypothetical protein